MAGAITYDLMLGELYEGEEGGISLDFPGANDVTFGRWTPWPCGLPLGNGVKTNLRGWSIPLVLFKCPSAVKMRRHRLAKVS